MRCATAWADLPLHSKGSMSSDRLPQTFGRYVLRERVGRGGMAEVFRASQGGFGGFDKDVAIKRMFREFSHDTAFVQMLTDEAKILSQLAHPNIVQILDLGQVGQDWFIAFEYVEGVDLFSVLQRHHEENRDMPVELACFVAAELCSALDYAHARRSADGEPLHIVHRDVSPQNVLLSLQGEVKLTDFGIAKAAYRFTQTQAGLIKGKVYYMSPDQVLGQPLDHRADLFAAGILLFEALTTQPLYDEPDQQRLFDRVSRAAWQWPAPKLGRIPSALQRIVEKALEPRADRRYSSGREMRQAITAAVRDLNLPCDRESLGSYLRRLYEVDDDRPPNYGAHQAMVKPDRHDERWNSQVNVRMPPPPSDLDDEPTSRDPALPPRLPVTRQARPGQTSGGADAPVLRPVPMAKKAAPAADPRPLAQGLPGTSSAPLAASLAGQSPSSASLAAAPGPLAVPPEPIAAGPAAPEAPPPRSALPARAQPVVTTAALVPGGAATGLRDADPPPLPAQARPAVAPAAALRASAGPPPVPTAPRPLARPAPRPAGPLASGEPPPVPAPVATPAPAALPRPAPPRAPPTGPQRALAPPPRPETPRPLRPEPIAPARPTPLPAPRPATRPPAPVEPPAVPALPAAPPPSPAMQQLAARVAEARPSSLSEEATFEMDQDQLARRLAAARAVVAESETRSVPAMADADLEDTTRPKPGAVRVQEPMPVALTVDSEELPAGRNLLLLTALVWVLAVSLAVYATLIAVRT